MSRMLLEVHISDGISTDCFPTESFPRIYPNNIKNLICRLHDCVRHQQRIQHIILSLTLCLLSLTLFIFLSPEIHILRMHRCYFQL